MKLPPLELDSLTYKRRLGRLLNAQRHGFMIATRGGVLARCWRARVWRLAEGPVLQVKPVGVDKKWLIADMEGGAFDLKGNEIAADRRALGAKGDTQ